MGYEGAGSFKFEVVQSSKEQLFGRNHVRVDIGQSPSRECVRPIETSGYGFGSWSRMRVQISRYFCGKLRASGGLGSS